MDNHLTIKLPPDTTAEQATAILREAFNTSPEELLTQVLKDAIESVAWPRSTGI